MVETTAPKYPSIPDIVAAMVEVFNAEVVDSGRYSPYELRIHPITKEDVYERNHGIVGRSPRLVEECRLLCYHIATRNTRVWDPLDEVFRYWKYRQVGAAMGGRSERAIEKGTHSCCILLANNEACRSLLHNGLRALTTKGFDLWAVPKSMSDNPCEPT